MFAPPKVLLETDRLGPSQSGRTGSACVQTLDAGSHSIGGNIPVHLITESTIRLRTAPLK
eukprot:6094222-Amphidinium_carterae.1